MIGYITLGTGDLKRAAKFYDAIAAELGAARIVEQATNIVWSRQDGSGEIDVTVPFDGRPATIGNGVMVALRARDRAQVHRLYAIALANGGTDEGAPGPRGNGGFYAAYFRDPDGNKLNAYIMPGQL